MSRRQSRNHRGRGVFCSARATVLLLVFAFSAAHAELRIADKPLFVTAGVEPNIIAAIDDSGSMDSEILMPTNDGALWWNTGDESFVGRDFNDAPSTSGVLNYNRGGGAGNGWKKYIYLFPNGTGNGDRVYSDKSNDHYAIPPFPQFAFVRSADYNGMYYDYRINYAPWPAEGSASFSNADPSAVRSDPTEGSGTLDLRGVIENTSNNWVFRLHEGVVVPAGVRYYDSGWKSNTQDIEWTSNSNTPISYFPATYYVLREASSIYTLEDADGFTVQGDCASPSPDHYRLFEARPSTLNGIDALAYDGGCLDEYRIAEDTTFPSGRSRDEELQNFANWYAYARKRHMATRAGIGRAFSRLTGLRAGAITINSRGSLNGMYSLSIDAEREDFFDYIYGRGGNSGGTPNREALKAVGDFFNSSSSGVVTESCQQNFALLFTDGFSNPKTISGIGNEDGDLGPPFADDYSSTIADVAARFYNEPLGGRTSENVPVPAICATDEPPPYIDCNRKPHMVTYGITLGATGLIFGSEEYKTLRDAHENPPTWQQPSTQRNPVQVDDLYHAAVNSRGGMLNARTAEELAAALSAALLEIVDRASSAGTSSSTSEGIATESLLIFSVEFRSDDWSGDILARSPDGVDLDNDGQMDVPGVVWSAEQKLAARVESASGSPRQLFSFSGADGIALSYDADSNATPLSAEQLAALGNIPADPERRLELLNAGLITQEEHDSVEAASSTLAAARIAWLNGEEREGLRSRRTKDGDLRLIGDIVSSTPVYLGRPNIGGNGYANIQAESMAAAASSYKDFLAQVANRQAVLLVASNDGFFRVINADTGDELFAYLPSELLEPLADGAARINSLMEPAYEHAYFNDGTPMVHDVFLNGVWRTVVVGTTGLGGRTVYAIDITDPTSMDENSVLWEFRNSGLGVGVTAPAIAPMRDGKFYVLLGNGYNTDNQESELFIVDLEDGTLTQRVSTGVGSDAQPNGLGPVEVTSWPVNDRLVNYAYAGDLYGNLWRFDLSSASPTQWDEAPAKVFEATDPDGVAQPITVRPAVSVFPLATSELMLNFGTGSFFREDDNSLESPQIQSLYGIREVPVNQVIEREDLLVQQITWQSSVVSGGQQRTVRELSNNTYDMSGNANSQEKGWVLDLVYQSNRQGERVISSATFPSGFGRSRVRFSSLIPSGDVCDFGRVGFNFDLDLATGGRTVSSVFDINEDGLFTKADMVDGRVINAITGGFGEAPATVQDRSNRRDLLYGGDGTLIISADPDEFMAPGRQSWQQLR